MRGSSVAIKKPHPRTFENFLEFQELCATFGAKGSGLNCVPKLWTPPYCIIPTDQFTLWAEGHDLTSISEEILEWAKEIKGLIILRSSAEIEGLGDRGSYRSIELENPMNVQIISEAIREIYLDYERSQQNGAIGIIAQEHIDFDHLGHLSNERRFHSTKNQWKYEFETSKGALGNVNSQRDAQPKSIDCIEVSTKHPEAAFRRIGAWVNSWAPERAHIEWGILGDQIYILQIDLEWEELDKGVTPEEIVPDLSNNVIAIGGTNHIKLYQLGEPTNWRKLKNLSDFDYNITGKSPLIYQLSGELIYDLQRNSALENVVIDELKTVTNNRVVVRTDCADADSHSFNLPRTDTVGSDEAILWCQTQLSKLLESGLEPSQIMFLAHAFIPAKAAAWAYANQGSGLVIVEALWGLPDGMQYCPVDSYEVSVAAGKIIQTKSNYKPFAVIEQEDGKWEKVAIKAHSGRRKVLAQSSILEIAERTKLTADKLETDAQIMWFCDIPENYGLGQNLPWFRARESLPEAPRHAAVHPDFLVERPSDLDRIPPADVTIQLNPEVQFIRDDEFLDRVIESSLERKLSVKLEGSQLSHAFYRLARAGVDLVLPGVSRYSRHRSPRAFKKLVRDRIPEIVRENGEVAYEALLHKDDIISALAGKLIEETEELISATSPDEIVAEMADLYELLRGLAFHLNLEWDEIENTALAKRQSRGGFEQRKILLNTELPKRGEPSSQLSSVRNIDLVSVARKGDGIEVPLGILTQLTNGVKVLSEVERADIGGIEVSLSGGALKITLKPQGITTDHNQLNLFEDGIFDGTE